MTIAQQQIRLVMDTLKPAIERFKALDEVYRRAGSNTPLQVELGWNKFKRVSQHAAADLLHW